MPNRLLFGHFPIPSSESFSGPMAGTGQENPTVRVKCHPTGHPRSWRKIITQKKCQTGSGSPTFLHRRPLLPCLERSAYQMASTPCHFADSQAKLSLMKARLSSNLAKKSARFGEFREWFLMSALRALEGRGVCNKLLQIANAMAGASISHGHANSRPIGWVFDRSSLPQPDSLFSEAR